MRIIYMFLGGFLLSAIFSLVLGGTKNELHLASFIGVALGWMAYYENK